MHNFLYPLALMGMFITGLPLFSQVTFDKHSITQSFTDGMEVCPADINKDGHMDFAAAGRLMGGQVAWWENDGYEQFIKHVVENNLDGIRSVRVVDLDQDNDMDLVGCTVMDNEVLWWENDGSENFTSRTIDPAFTGGHTVAIYDVNDDGYLDVLCCGFVVSGPNPEVAWWENDGNQNWTKHYIDDRYQRHCSVDCGDFDGDGDLDIVSCGEQAGHIAWWEVDGTIHFVDTLIYGIHTVIAKDVDYDGDDDLLGASCIGSKVAWYENNGDGTFIKHLLGYFAGALWLDAADFDEDGDRDLVGAPQGGNQLSWWQNNGSQVFTKHNFQDPFQQAFTSWPMDMDNDNDTDVIAIGYTSDEIAWFENRFRDPNHLIKPESVVYDYVHQRYLVSSYGKGAIVELDTAGNQSFFYTNVNTPLGMVIDDGVLYVSDIDTLRGINLITKELVMNLHLPALQHIDGLAADSNGYIYVVDTYGRIFKVNKITHGFSELVGTGLLPMYTQDIVYDQFNHRLVVAAWAANASIYGVDLSDSTVTELTINTPGYFDGITMDHEGYFYLASHNGGKILKYDPGFSNPGEVISTGHDDPAGLNYNTQDHILAVPNFEGNSVDFIYLGSTSIPESSGSVLDLHFYPNPASGAVRLGYQIHDICYLISDLYSIEGRKIRELERRVVSPGNYEMQIDISSLQDGVYMVRVQTGREVYFSKLIIEH